MLSFVKGHFKLTLPMLIKATFVKNIRTQRFWQLSKPCHVGIHWIAFTEYSLMSTPMSRVWSCFLALLHDFVLAKLAISSIRVKKTIQLFAGKILVLETKDGLL